MLFNKKKKKEENNVSKENLADKVEKDLIVHNMPKEESLQGSTVNPLAAGKISVSNEGNGVHKQSKIIGALIIIIGLIVISGLVYGTYYFAIKPVANENNQQTNINQQNIQEEVIEEKNEEEENKIIEDDLNNEELIEEDIQIEIIDDEEEDEISEVEIIMEVVVLDSDNDLLSDKEEIVLGTNLNKTDSDDDSYNDLLELNNLYNPIGDGVLSDNENLNKYTNEKYSLNFLYPRDFVIKNDESELFILETIKSSFFQLTITENIDNQGILVWYETNFPQANISESNLISKDNFEAVISEDGLNVYLTDSENKYFYIFSYAPSEDEGVAYKNIFRMMINTFSFND